MSLALKTNLRQEIPYEEFDYPTLLHALREYRQPRARITALLRQGRIIRVKKGLYIFGEAERRRPYSKEILANLIYGPSCISLDFALHYYGLIPERVIGLTSVTIGRSREFFTPVGHFSYRTIPLKAFQHGIGQAQTEDGRFYLMALPEKALADKIRLDKVAISTQKEMLEYLMGDLRIDSTGLMQMDVKRIQIYAEAYGSRKISLLSRVIEKLRKKERPHA